MLWWTITDTERVWVTCPSCDHKHYLDFCPKCGYPSPYFEAEAVNAREQSHKLLKDR